VFSCIVYNTAVKYAGVQCVCVCVCVCVVSNNISHLCNCSGFAIERQGFLLRIASTMSSEPVEAADVSQAVAGKLEARNIRINIIKGSNFGRTGRVELGYQGRLG
jgi:hypothetical protein